MKIEAVLTGDIVNSTRLSSQALASVFASLEETADMIRSWTQRDVPGLDRHRGDGWQFVPPHPMFSLRAALALRASVRRLGDEFDTRIAVGIGPGVVRENLGGSEGQAFELSGRLLSLLGGAHRLAADASGLHPDRPHGPEWALFKGMFRLGDAISSGWTTRQAELFLLQSAPRPPSAAEIAGRLGVSRQAVESGFNRAGGDALTAACESVETALGELE